MAETDKYIEVGSTCALLNCPDEVQASIVLVPGGNGHLGLVPNGPNTFGLYATNHPVVTRKDYAEQHDIATLLLDRREPRDVVDSDPNNGDPANLGHAVSEMRRRFGKPVALLVFSRAAVRLWKWLLTSEGGRPDGLILASAFLIENQNRRPAGAVPGIQGALGTPAHLPPRVLVVHHERDWCNLTPSSEVARFVEWTNGVAEPKWITGGRNVPGKDICKSESVHGFFEAHDEAVEHIAAFVRSLE